MWSIRSIEQLNPMSSAQYGGPDQALFPSYDDSFSAYFLPLGLLDYK